MTGDFCFYTPLWLIEIGTLNRLKSGAFARSNRARGTIAGMLECRHPALRKQGEIIVAWGFKSLYRYISASGAAARHDGLKNRYVRYTAGATPAW